MDTDQGVRLSFTDDMTLGEARALLRTLVDVGHKCPCCTQFAKVYKRTVTAQMAATLIAMSHAPREAVGWLYLPEVPQRSRDTAGMAYWHLIEQRPKVKGEVLPTGAKHSGYWRITQRGWAWLRDEVGIEKYAHVYDGRCLKLTGDTVGIRVALGDRFNYDELMMRSA